MKKIDFREIPNDFWEKVLVLTTRTVYRGPPGDLAGAQFRPAGQTSLAAPAIHPKAVLKRPGVPPCRTVITDGTAAGRDGFAQHFLQRGMQATQTFA